MAAESLIHFKGVRKAFGPKVIYTGLDLDMSGEVLTIVGGSGVGKSVMLKMLIGLLRADRGSILFDGKEVTADERGASWPTCASASPCCFRAARCSTR